MWTPPLVRRQLNCVRMWNRLLKMNEHRRSRRIFIWDYTKCRNNWCHEVRNILKSIDVGEKLLSAQNNMRNAIISIDAAKDKLMLKYKHKSIYTQRPHSKSAIPLHKCGNYVASQTKLGNYHRIVKQEFGAEEYVKFVINKKTTIDSSSATSMMPSYRNRASVRRGFLFLLMLGWAVLFHYDTP